MTKPDDSLLREMPAWIKVFGALYFAALLAIGWVVFHFIAKFW